MKERQIEAMYRARFDERRHATEALDNLYTESTRGHDITERAWLVAVGHPRVPNIRARLSRAQARDVINHTEGLALTFASSSGIHPLASVDRLNPRPGLRRWVAANTATYERARWKEAWLSIHHDGSVTLAAALGGHRIRDGFLGGHQVESRTIECGIADFMALIRATARETGNSEYDLRVGVEWTGENPLIVLTDDGYGFSHDIGSTPLQQFTPVESTVDASEPDIDFYWHVYDVAQDCVNQGGIAHLHMIKPPARNSDGQGTSTA